MELDEQETPQKLTRKLVINYQTKNRRQSISPHQHNVSPKCLKVINPRTPKAQSVSYSVAACSSMVSNNNSLHSISMAMVQTPPAKRFQRVKNPFEAALAERLHLPLIASPSLFQRPNTPQMSSTQFEWTIDQVSSLNPANVEPHETQFQDSLDPELEAKAQSAISSYFKEQQIVPSPIDCPLRSHRIILSEINGDTPISKPGRRIRDCSSQTELTLPPVLPPNLEEALKPYFQPHLSGVGKEFKNSDNSSSWRSHSGELKDTSLRRKLFDMKNIALLENENLSTCQQLSTKTSNDSAHSNFSPVSLKSLQNTAIIGKLSDSSDKSSFGSLSPISALDSLSPNCITPSITNRKIRFGDFLRETEAEMPSPIQLPSRGKRLTENNRSRYRNQANDATQNEIATNSSSYEGAENERFTPERSSSPLNKIQNDNIGEFSTDSFNVKVSRLKVNSSKAQSKEQERINKTENKSFTEFDIFQHDETDDILENTVDMDEMQVSLLSGHSSNCSSSQSDTPRGKRRSASRKNLSQSFSAIWPQDEDEDELDTSQTMKIKEILAKKQFVANSTNKTEAPFSEIRYQNPANTTPTKSSTFYRTDSGFNEISQNSSSSCEGVKSQDIKQPELLSHRDLSACCSRERILILSKTNL